MDQRPDKVNQEREIEKPGYQVKTVIIDPGHGGHDPGCLGRQSQEKHIALGIAKQLAQSFSVRFPTIKVILTRETDVFVPLYERAAIANRNNADLFISIHCNYFPNRSTVYGTETYVMGLHTADHNLEVAKRENAAILLEVDYERNYDYDPNSPEGHILLSMYQNAYLEQSILFAEMVEAKAHTHAQRKSRGVKQAGFVVLKETAMPSVLIETGFLSHAEEERFLNTEQGQQTIASAIIEAFEEYKNNVEYGAIAATPLPPESREVSRPIQKPDPFTTPPSSSPSATTTYPAQVVNNREEKPSPSPANPLPATSYNPSNTPNPPPSGSSSAILPPASRKPANPATPSREIYSGVPAIQFHVQLAASPRPVNPDEARWKKLNYQVEVVMEDNLYKYQVRNFSSLEEASEARTRLRTLGFADAFLVAYKNGKRISMEEARKELGL